jgi:hypothetical protein
LTDSVGEMRPLKLDEYLLNLASISSSLARYSAVALNELVEVCSLNILLYSKPEVKTYAHEVLVSTNPGQTLRKSKLSFLY